MDDGSEQLGGMFNRALNDLMDCPVPTAKVNGAAAGGGFGWPCPAITIAQNQRSLSPPLGRT